MISFMLQAELSTLRPVAAESALQVATLSAAVEAAQARNAALFAEREDWLVELQEQRTACNAAVDAQAQAELKVHLPFKTYQYLASLTLLPTGGMLLAEKPSDFWRLVSNILMLALKTPLENYQWCWFIFASWVVLGECLCSHLSICCAAGIAAGGWGYFDRCLANFEGQGEGARGTSDRPDRFVPRLIVAVKYLVCKGYHSLCHCHHAQLYHLCHCRLDVAYLA